MLGAEPQPDPIGKLLDRVGVDLDGLGSEAEEAPGLDLYRLNLAIGPSLDVDDLADIPVVGAEDAHSPQVGELSRSCLQGRHHTLASTRQRIALVDHALADPFSVAAFGLDVVPAGFGNALDAVNGIAELARRPVQGELASQRQLILVRLHAQENSTLAACDGPAEFLDVLAATAGNGIRRGRYTIPQGALPNGALSKGVLPNGAF